jgi:hypothetical protein
LHTHRVPCSGLYTAPAGDDEFAKKAFQYKRDAVGTWRLDSTTRMLPRVLSGYVAPDQQLVAKVPTQGRIRAGVNHITPVHKARSGHHETSILVFHHRPARRAVAKVPWDATVATSARDIEPVDVTGQLVSIR